LCSSFVQINLLTTFCCWVRKYSLENSLVPDIFNICSRDNGRLAAHILATIFQVQEIAVNVVVGTQQQPPSSSSSSRDSVESVVMTPHTTYFYQLANGQHVYLHPLCVRMLIAAAEETSHLRRRRNSNRSDSGDSGTSTSAGATNGGGVGNESSDGDQFGHNDGDDFIAPASGAVDAGVEIGSGASKRKSKSRHRAKADDYQLELTTAVTANIVEIEVCKLTTELRQRVPFLRHLSLGTTVTLLELDVKDIVPHSILPKFKDELHGREKKRIYRVQEKLRELELDEEQK
jgi:hypothetical protein